MAYMWASMATGRRMQWIAKERWAWSAKQRTASIKDFGQSPPGASPFKPAPQRKGYD